MRNILKKERIQIDVKNKIIKVGADKLILWLRKNDVEIASQITQLIEKWYQSICNWALDFNRFITITFEYRIQVIKLKSYIS